MSAYPPPAPAPLPRHALNWPAGSVRALLAFGILLILWLLVLFPMNQGSVLLRQQASMAFIYLQFLMVLILGHFITAHGHTIGGTVSRRSPLGLPKGSVRLLLVGGYLGLAFYLYSNHRAFDVPETGPVILLLLVLITGFFLGHVSSGSMRFVNGGRLPAWYQDVEAWVSILALFFLGAIILVRLVINTSLPEEVQFSLQWTEAVLAGLVGFYFGARS